MSENKDHVLYTVKYKSPGMWFWRTLRGVIADGLENGSRWFIHRNEARVEIPLAETRFFFSHERMDLIRRNIERSKADHVEMKQTDGE